MPDGVHVSDLLVWIKTEKEEDNKKGPTFFQKNKKGPTELHTFLILSIYFICQSR